MRILVANRGEIARRVIRTAHRLGAETVAVYSDADRHAPFVGEATMAHRLGPADPARSYLSSEAVLAAAAATATTAIHPGYGFLSENAGFARAVMAAGLVWIGPDPEVMAAMASKIEARRLAGEAGVPVIPGFDGDQDAKGLGQAADRIGFPVLIKASAGGGGKGIRIASAPEHFPAALREARTEAERAFGDPTVLVERYITQPRHIEVQVVGDHHNNVVHLGTRECSVQRRYQKLLEEAPAPRLPDATRAELEARAVGLAEATGYDSAGTVEYILDDHTGQYFFLEMNTRLQVEHPVTEMVTGLDLVELQILAAHGEPLPVTQQDITFTGHAFEARINAENPATGFTPQTGTISHLRVPHDVRWDSAVEVGSEATPYYDSMIAKLITTGPDRESARLRLAETLEEILIGGFTTTTGFHRWLINQPALINSTITTRYLDETPVPDPPAPPAGMAAAAWKASRRAEAPSDAWHQLHLFRNSDQTAFDPVILEDQSGAIYEVEPHGWAWTGTHLFDVADQVGRHTAAVDTNAGLVWVNLDGHTFSFNALTRSEHWAAKATGSLAALEDAIVAPFPAVVSEVLVAPGDELTPDDPVVVIEAMKMLHTLSTPSRAVVAAVRVEVGDQVESGQVLVTLEPPPTEAGSGR